MSPQHPLLALRDELATARGPIVVFNKSHSGSRLLAKALHAGGVFMGAHQNASYDSEDVLPLVEHLVLRHYPDYAGLWRDDLGGDHELPALIRAAFARHLDGFDRGAARPWGWKLCETTYILPVIDLLFPHARYVHLIRDGRDVAFCDHIAPRSPFWKKIYFNTDRIERWRRLRLTHRDYRRRPHVYNALHWTNSVALGRAFGAMLRERCLQIRYEDLCRNFAPTLRRVFAFAGVGDVERMIAQLGPDVHETSIAKHRHRSRWKLRQVLAVAKPELLALGYLSSDG
jgi:hypothetical protein